MFPDPTTKLRLFRPGAGRRSSPNREVDLSLD
jgi:hypothetical protein